MSFRFACRCAVLFSFVVGNLKADWWSDLRSQDPEVRWVGVNELQTLEDPRIPESCLPLLADEGSSIRRQAARAIGSRFATIAPEHKQRYLEELEKCEERGPEDVSLIAQRAIGLLTENYGYPSFSVSPNGKWVLYERRRLPVIANIREQRHDLLSPLDPAQTARETSGLLKMMTTTGSAQDLFSPHWSRDGQAVAFEINTLELRFYRPICVWTASNSKVQVLSYDFFKSLLKSHPATWGTTTEFAGWKGNEVRVRIFDYLDVREDVLPRGPETLVSYDTGTGQIRLEK